MPDQYWLSKGAHTSAKDGRCALEWVSYLAGEPHSDAPVCVSTVLQRFCSRFNDRLGDEDRQKLRPYLARTIGTRGDGRDAERGRMCIEFLVETSMPRLLAHDPIAVAELRALPPLLAAENAARVVETCVNVRGIARASRDRSFTELKRAAGAAWAAWAAGAAEAAEAAWAAWAAGAAEGAWAFRDRVEQAARRRLREINAELNPLAFELLDRMLPTEVIQLPAVEDAHLVCGIVG
jgi:hypothetical protein